MHSLWEKTRGTRERLGSGSYGSVWNMELWDTQRYAVKVIREKTVGHEVLIHARLGRDTHKNIAQYYFSCPVVLHKTEWAEVDPEGDQTTEDATTKSDGVDPNEGGQDDDDERTYSFLLMELFPRGCLKTFLDARSSTKAVYRPQMIEFLTQLTTGLRHLEKFNVVHLDIKPANILLAGEECSPVLKIADFGLSLNTGAKAACGSHPYCAPEMLSNTTTATATSACDVYSLGVVFCELFILERGDEPQGDERTTMRQALSYLQCAGVSSECTRLQQVVKGEVDWELIRKMVWYPLHPVVSLHCTTTDRREGGPYHARGSRGVVL